MTDAYDAVQVQDPPPPFGMAESGSPPIQRAVVDVREHIAPGTKKQEFLGAILGLGGGAVTILLIAAGTMGLGLIGVLVWALVAHHKAKLNRVLIEGSGVKVGPRQMGKIHGMVADVARRLQMDPPECFVIESNEQNASAMKSRGINAIVLTDDMVWGAMSTKDLRVLEFVIAHEMAHHKLGHLGWYRSTIATANKSLSRLNEFTCDSVAAKIVGDLESSAKALALLAVGPQLLPKVNIDDLINQSKSIAENKLAKKAERPLTHPLMLRRIARVLGVEMKLV